MKIIDHGLRRRLLSTALVLIAAASAVACQVPVFRYALERWPADRYEVLIVHRGQLSPADQARVQRLKDSNYQSVLAANFEVRTVNIEGDLPREADQALVTLWNENSAHAAPVMVVLYPRNAQEVPNRIAGVVPLSDATVEHLVDSPVRQKLVAELLSGQSAVWIFVPSGQKEKDELALKTLQQQVKLNQEQLELPPQDEIEADELFKASTKIELRLGFSIVTLDREDPKEEWLLKLLMSSESDLNSLDEPMAFPVLGRGRVLYALVGKGIMPETIGMASRFVVGPCSCQVKEQNPGFDLLVGVDWDERIGVETLSKPLPELPSEPVLLSIPPGRTSRSN